MAGEPPLDDPVPPISEQVHLPGPSYLPVGVAFGVTLALLGVIFSWVVAAIGAILTVVLIVRWAADTRRDIAELPLDH